MELKSRRFFPAVAQLLTDAQLVLGTLPLPRTGRLIAEVGDQNCILYRSVVFSLEWRTRTLNRVACTVSCAPAGGGSAGTKRCGGNPCAAGQSGPAGRRGGSLAGAAA